MERLAEDAPPVAYKRLSQANRELGDDAAAAEALARGLERFPDDVELHLEFAGLAIVGADWREAVARCQALLSRFGDDAPASAHVRLSQAYRLAGDADAAAEAVARGLAKFPDDSRLHVEFAQLATSVGEWGEAVSRWQAVVDRFGAYAPPASYAHLSRAHRMNGDDAAALDAVSRGLKQFPGDVRLHAELAELAMAAGDWDTAALHWRAALDRFGGDAPQGTQYALVRTLMNAGNEEAAAAVVAERVTQQRGAYQDWILANDKLFEGDRAAIRGLIASLTEPPTFSVLMPVHDPEPGHLRQALDSVLTQLYPHWELYIVDDASTNPQVREIIESCAAEDRRVKTVFQPGNTGIAGATNAALELASGEWVALMDHDDVLAEHALYMMAEAVSTSPNAAVLYSDSDHLDGGGHRIDPHFKPDWDPDLLLGQNFISHLGVYRADLARAVGGFREGYEGSQDWDFLLRVVEAGGEDSVVHVPHILYHWRIVRDSVSQSKLQAAVDAGARAVSDHLERTGAGATVKPGVAGLSWNRIQWPAPSPEPLVSVIIPTRDSLDLLRPCIQGIDERTDYPAIEIVVMDNGSRDAETLEYLEAIAARDDVQVVRDDDAFAFSRLCNRGVAASRGEVVLLLNNDIEVTHPEWLRELVGHAVRPEVGAVGAKLYYPNDSIQHAGVILGIGKNGIGGHAYRFMPRVSEPKVPFGRTALTRNCSAVTAACMALRRDVYEEVDGLDEENLTVSFNDVDLCLRIRTKGFRVIWTPFAELRHHESISRGTATTPEKIARARAEVAYMRERWGELLRADPFFNPNLSLASEDFSLAPRTRAPKPWRQRGKDAAQGTTDSTQSSRRPHSSATRSGATKRSFSGRTT